MKNQTLFFLILTLLVWSGCASRQNMPITIYTLKADTFQGKEKIPKFKNKTLQIKLPTSTKEIRKNKILYASTRYERDSYIYSRWSDTPNRLVAEYLRSYLDQSALFKAVVDESSIANADYILESNLEDFYQLFDTDKNAYGVIKIHFFLIDATKKKVLFSRFIHFQIPSSSLDAKGGVRALYKATEHTAEALLKWLQNSHI